MTGHGRQDDKEWTWPCKLLGVVDGDTIDLVIDRGFKDRTIDTVRLYGVDTAEIHNTEHGSDEYELGMEQKRFVQRWFEIDSDEEFPFRLHTYEQEGSFGRWLGDISLNGNYLSEAILEEWPKATY